jgi:hypothetical protein
LDRKSDRARDERLHPGEGQQMLDAPRAMFNASVVGEGQSGPFSTSPAT